MFSNEAGIGSATIAHSAVRTSEPLSEGFVSLLEPFIDTVVICSATALVVITTSWYDPEFAGGLGGIDITSAAFERTWSAAPIPLAVAATLFAVSTMIAWSYYGLKGWTYLFGHGKRRQNVFNSVFCLFIVLGCMLKLAAILDISDALVFLICVPNVFGLYLLAPVVRERLEQYDRLRSGEAAAETPAE